MSKYLDYIVHSEVAKFLASYIKKNHGTYGPTMIRHMINDHYGTEYSEQSISNMLQTANQDLSKVVVDGGPVT